MNDIELLRRYADENSEEAFAAIVFRYINLVYSVALRHVAHSHQAEEITQAVFIILSRKAKSLSAKIILSGWLYQTARLTAANYVRGEIRRQNREREAYMESLLNDTPPDADETWAQIAPLLDKAMAHLREKDRNVIVLRFFEGKSLSEVGTALGIEERAAQKRVLRSVEKLRAFFVSQGVKLSTSAVAESVAARSVQAAPVVLAKSIISAAMGKGAATTSTLTTVKGALKLMAWTKTKMAILVGGGVLLAVGTTTVAVKEFRSPSVEEVFMHCSEDKYLAKAPAVVVLRPSRYRRGMQINHMHGPPFSKVSERFVGLDHPLSWVLGVAYDFGPERMVLPPDLPEGTFDLLDAVRTNPKLALQEEIKRQFGLVAHVETQPKDVLVLTVSNPSAQGLKINRSGSADHGIHVSDGKLTLVNFAMSGITGMAPGSPAGAPVVRTNLDDSMVNALGGYFFGAPVLDETGLTDSYDIELQWDGRLKGEEQTMAIKEALREQLGLELTRTNLPIETLVVEYQDGHQTEPALPQASWAFVGYETPEAAFQSALAAMSAGDLKAFLACLTPDFQKGFMVKEGGGKSEGTIAAENKRNAAKIVAFQVTSKEALSDDETILYLRSTRLGHAQVAMKKIKGEWKMDGEPH